MKEMLHQTRQGMSPAKGTVDNDSLLSIIMRSDMAKALPHIAAAMARSVQKEETLGEIR